MTPKAVVFGSGGQLGQELCTELRHRGYQVQGYERRQIDVSDPAKVEEVLAQFDPAVVFNAAAYNQVDVAEREPQAAYMANALAVRNLAVACRQIDARLVHYSTDYVFDGTLGRAYVETDTPHPLGAYAVSKLAGELYAQAYLDRPVIIRTSGVYGPAGRATNRGNFVETMLRLARGGQPIRVVQDLVASPTYAPLLAARSIDLLATNQSGVFHLGGGVPISWFDFAAVIFKAAGLQPELQPTAGREYRTEAKRPRYSALSNAKIEAAGVAPMPSMEEAVAQYFAARPA
ncbi:MAG TPA: dTDP-4-dehydrorhamnose reductase [Bryobacteraceae bacterium]